MKKILLLFIFAIFGGCTTRPPIIQYQYVCRDIYLSDQLYDAATDKDIDTLYEYAVWCNSIKNE